MKLSRLHLKTLREAPNEAELISHKLMIRANLIKKEAAGIYTFMPFGWRTIRKIEDIVRQEQDRIGCQELHMPHVNPSELWKESGRWYAYGPELWRIKDRNGRDFCLVPTCEELCTNIVKQEISSYRELPLQLYHIQFKYRDEARPRYGLMRSREFIMKDAYSFDRTPEDLEVAYRLQYDAYVRTFSRCGLDFRIVEADNGPIGGSNSHEFSALSNVGESEIAYCEKCDMAATIERAECIDEKPVDEPEQALETVYTPGTKTIKDVCDFLGVEEKQTVKALMFTTFDQDLNPADYVCVFIRGDRDVNMIKLVNALGIPEHYIEFADEDEMGPVTGIVGGFTGPVGIHNCKIVVDSELVGTKNMVAGANKEDHHMKGVCYGRDYVGDIVTDIKTLKEGDPCPHCGAPIKHTRGIEVGQIFKLGTKYSDSMSATYKDENGEDQIYWMGCYGIGITRTMQAIVEQSHDDKGIIWPMSVAPYHVIVTVINPADEVQMKIANKIESELEAKRVEVLVDDRDERAGVKFNDADLIGIPVRITVGKLAKDGNVEYKLRREEGNEVMSADEAIKAAAELVDKEIFGL
ncbi:proline--tRNA ligase [Mogibacterium pumilum]|uniref:Proline--tRNA ligase n=1 Tax=Mogibacterium pumilum TaxID=86332 RepID=A0A223ARM5_9FIRM|nr:proline--tRNA ligase [Mogibacterium pumilum]ASS37597.1 proline--tRNA ligase [Mogibacterium pumilum]